MWDTAVATLQDICGRNETLSIDNTYSGALQTLQGGGEAPAEVDKAAVAAHKDNIAHTLKLAETFQATVSGLLQEQKTQPKAAEKKRKVGRLYHVLKYNPHEPIVVGSEVAYKLRNRHGEEWIQCEVTRVIGDGVRFEVRDPEPDENNNPGQTFKASYREVILIAGRAQGLPPYEYGAKVLARYPETTTFYPAVVVGMRKDRVRLKFDGEEEANKETEVERRLVLPHPV